MKFDLQIKWNPKSVINRMKKSPEIINDEMYDLLDTLRVQGTRAAEKKAPDDRSGLRQSLYPGPKSFSVTTVVHAVIGSKLPYAAAQDQGTRPFWTPVQPIKDWVHRNNEKFGISKRESEVNRVTYFVRRKIARHGIKGKHYLNAGLNAVRRHTPRAVREAVDKIIRRLGL